LTGLYREIVELRAEILIRAGRADAAVPSLRELSRRFPLDEAAAAVLIECLHAADRRSEALEEYDRIRRDLRDELGLNPNRRLRDTHRAVLISDDTDAGNSDDARIEPASPRAVPPPARAPAQLPPLQPTFVGRSVERDALLSLLPNDSSAREEDAAEGAAGASGPKIVVIEGPGGVGKTSLALWFAHRCAGRYPEGQLFVDMQAFGPDERRRTAGDVLPGMLVALGMPRGHIPTEMQEQSALLRTTLADRRVLIMLDNVGSADAVRALLPGTANSLVIVTSRRRLSGLAITHGARRVTLQPLPEPECFELVDAVLGTGTCARNPAASRALVGACGRWPLALRIAIERVALAQAESRDPVAAIASVAEELVGADSQLIGRLSLDDDAASDIGEVLSWSYQRLESASDDGPDTTRLYRRLGQLPVRIIDPYLAACLLGPADDPQAVDWVADSQAVNRADHLTQTLAAHHLVQERRGGWFMHDMIKQHAHDRAMREEQQPDSDAAIRRVLSWYASAASSATERMLNRPVESYLADPAGVAELMPLTAEEAARWFEIRADDLYTCQQVALQLGHPAAWQILLLLQVAPVDVQNPQNYPTLAADAADAAERAGAYAAEAALLINLSVFYDRARMSSQHMELYPAAVTAARRSEHTGLNLIANVNWADAVLRQGRVEDALLPAQRALSLLEAADPNRPGHWLKAGTVHCAMFEIATRAGNRVSAQHHLRLALNAAVASDSPRTAIFIWMSLGRVLIDAGQFRRAYRLLVRARDIAGPENVNGRDRATVLARLAEAALAVGKTEEAADCAQSASRYFDQFGRHDAEAGRAAAVLSRLSCGDHARDTLRASHS